MQISRDGDAGQVVRITGPAHNLLRLEFGKPAGAFEVRNLVQPAIKDEQEGLSIQLRERARREIGIAS